MTADGVVHGCVNLGWGEIALDDELTRLSGFPVVVGNDANVAALGESWVGAGKDCSSVVVVTLGTGIGGGIVIDGKLLPGSHGAGGEIGHIVVNREETDRCNCGLCGCFEQYASATGIVRMARKYLTESQKDSTLRSEENISAKTIFDAARDGDEMALEIVHDVCGKLGLTLARISAVVDPEMFLLGGGVSRAGQILLDEVKKAYDKYVFQGCSSTKIGLASLGNDAGMYGSAKLIFDEVLPASPKKKKVVLDV